MSIDAHLKVLADPTRLKIVQFLADPTPSSCSRGDGVCGCDLEGVLGLAQPTVSHHMKVLGEAGLVRSERRGRWVYYDLEPAPFRELVAALEGFARAAERSRRSTAA